MRKIGKTILTIVVILLSAVAAGLTALSFGIKLVDQSGWDRAQTGIVYYLDWEGNPQQGWKTIDGNLYYLDPQRQGAMTVGWLQIGDVWHYFDEEGVMQTGWLDLHGSRFYLRPDGTMASGWEEIDEQHYYFDEEGEMQVGWLELGDRRFYLGIDGVACFGWQDTVDGRCYLTLDGEIRSGWQDVDGQRYFFNEDGFLVYGWLSHEMETYYLDDSGVMQTGWLETDEGYYYLNDQGRMQTGWLDTETGRYFLGTDGIMDTGWITVGSHSYYLAENGVMQTGWLEQDGASYYLDANGAMSVGQVEIGDTSYFFTSTGKQVLLVNAWNPVPEDYEPDLVEYEGYLIERTCLEPLKSLLADCEAAGYTYSLNSIYRSTEDQQGIWDRRLIEYTDEGYTEEEALAIIAQSVAVPGTSEHHLGLAADVGGAWEMYVWMRENSWKYGFIVRYPDGKTDYTGIIYEPWHIRYVGVELAQELYELDLCMEEYMEQLTE